MADYFTKEQRKIIGEAVEDHRASLSYEPRSIYGKIISEADRDLDFYRILERTIYFAIEKSLSDPDNLCQEAFEYIQQNTVPTITWPFGSAIQKYRRLSRDPWNAHRSDQI